MLQIQAAVVGALHAVRILPVHRLSRPSLLANDMQKTVVSRHTDLSTEAGAYCVQLEPLVHGVQDLVLHAPGQGGCDGCQLAHLQAAGKDCSVKAKIECAKRSATVKTRCSKWSPCSLTSSRQI